MVTLLIVDTIQTLNRLLVTSFRIMKNYILFLLSTIIFFGCATPSAVKEQAASTLSAECYAIFTDGSLFRYQQLTHQLYAKVVFTYAQDSNGSVCAYASKMDTPEFNGTLAEVPWSSVETVALSRCEDRRRSTQVKSPCEVFARNNDLIWGKKEYIKLQ